MRDTRGQRGRRLLDRERRPGRRAHGRLGHGRPGAHAHGPRVPEAARHRHRGHPRGRRRHGRLQHPVRGAPRHGPHHRHRDEPARLALLGAGVQGDGVPDREDRREARGRATRSTRSPTTSRRSRPRRSSPRSTTSWSRSRASRSRSSRPRTRRSTTTMKSVGEAMAMGRNFTEALGKAMRSIDKAGSVFHWDGEPVSGEALDELLAEIARPTEGRLVATQQALRAGASLEQVFERDQDRPVVPGPDPARQRGRRVGRLGRRAHARRAADAKRHGLSDPQIAKLRGMGAAGESTVREVRYALGVRPVYKTVDTCAAEFAAKTPYHYSSYDLETEVAPRERPAVLILGSGPNRIGQGIEFDYSCVHADPRAQGRVRDRHGQLQPGDRLDGLRHLGPPLLRAAHVRGRPRGLPGRARRRPRRGHHRAARRPDPAEPRAAPGRRGPAHPRHLARGDRRRRGPRRVRPRPGRRRACPPRRSARRRRWPRPRRSPTASATRCSCARPTCSVGAAWRSSTRASSSRATSSVRCTPPRPTTAPRRARCPRRCSSTASSTTRWRSTSTRCTTAPRCSSAASWSTSRRPASTRATRPACCPRSR